MSIANLWIHPSLDLRLIGCVLIDLGLALRADSLWIYPIYLYQYRYINNFLDFFHGQRLHPVDRVVLSLFWDWNLLFIPFLKGGSFRT